MRSYNYKKIDDLVQPLIQMMQTEYPSNAQLVIDSNSATIQYVHKDLIFLETSLKPKPDDRNALEGVLTDALRAVGLQYAPDVGADDLAGGDGDG